MGWPARGAGRLLYTAFRDPPKRGLPAQAGLAGWLACLAHSRRLTRRPEAHKTYPCFKRQRAASRTPKKTKVWSAYFFFLSLGALF